jgi:tRNA1Val (adenine37-N6)-methyltransferase
MNSKKQVDPGAKRALLSAGAGAMAPAQETAAETLDSLFDGRLKLYQSRSGYRFSLDAVLLGHFLRLKQDARVADLGTGSGAVALVLAYRYPRARIIGIEIQPAMVERARRNAALNGLGERVTIVSGDVRRPATLPAPGSFTTVVCNPPYRSPLSGRVSRDPEKRLARHEFEGALGDFLRAAYTLLAGRGNLAVVYPAFRAVDVLAAMRAAGLEPKRLRMVHAAPEREASLLLIEGVKGARSALMVEAPLYVYEEPGRYSRAVAEMLNAGSGQF